MGIPELLGRYSACDCCCVVLERLPRDACDLHRAHGDPFRSDLCGSLEGCVDAANIFLLLAKVVAYATTGSKAVLASLADSAGTQH